MTVAVTETASPPGAFVRLWERLVSLVAEPGDDDEAIRKKRLLLVVALAKAPACPIAGPDLLQPRRAARGLVPVVYQGLTVVSVVAVPGHAQLRPVPASSRRSSSSLGPMALQYFLGGLRQLERVHPLVLPGAARRHPLPRRAPLLALVRGALDRAAGLGRRRSRAGAHGASAPGDRARLCSSCFTSARSAPIVYAAIRYHASLLDAEKDEQVSLNTRLEQSSARSRRRARAARGDATSRSPRPASTSPASSPTCPTSCARRSTPSSATARCSQEEAADLGESVVHRGPPEDQRERPAPARR